MLFLSEHVFENNMSLVMKVNGTTRIRVTRC